MDSVAVLTSVALQYGVPLRNLVEKFRGVHFEPPASPETPDPVGVIAGRLHLPLAGAAFREADRFGSGS